MCYVGKKKRVSVSIGEKLLKGLRGTQRWNYSALYRRNGLWRNVWVSIIRCSHHIDRTYAPSSTGLCVPQNKEPGVLPTLQSLLFCGIKYMHCVQPSKEQRNGNERDE